MFLGKYRVEEILGQGGMGIVARCTHLALNEQVAVKMLRHDVLMDEDATSRFMREAQAAVKLRSEYVARVSDVGTFENGVPYMVMEYLDGQDLGVLLEEQGKVAAQWATDLMLQTCEALAEAHSINIVHRDVKPTNLFVTWRPDGTSLIKVLDFGISKSPMGTDMQLTQTQSLLGTPAYMSPEQMRSARLVDQRTDIWSLGTVMYELLEGRRPFEADSFSEMCVKVAVDAPEPMIHTPPELAQVVLRCLAKSPEQRYPSMADLGRDLIPFARDPHAAQMMVERMFRMLGRNSNVSWEGASMKTPVPGHVRDFKSGPVGRAQSPVAAWHGKDATFNEPLTPAVLPVDVSPKKRSGMLIAVVAMGAIAAGAVGLVMFTEKHESKPSANVPPPGNVQATQPDPAPVKDVAVQPPETGSATVKPPDEAAPAPPDEPKTPAVAVDTPKQDETPKQPDPRAKQKQKERERLLAAKKQKEKEAAAAAAAAAAKKQKEDAVKVEPKPVDPPVEQPKGNLYDKPRPVPK